MPTQKEIRNATQVPESLLDSINLEFLKYQIIIFVYNSSVIFPSPGLFLENAKNEFPGSLVCTKCVTSSPGAHIVHIATIFAYLCEYLLIIKL